MTFERLLLAAAAALLIGGCASPPSVQAPGAADDSDAGLTCTEKTRAHVLCEGAVSSRCESQQSDCEAACEVRGGLPANTQKVSSTRDEMESTACRDRCRTAHDQCARSMDAQCPGPCTIP